MCNIYIEIDLNTRAAAKVDELEIRRKLDAYIKPVGLRRSDKNSQESTKSVNHDQKLMSAVSDLYLQG